MQQFLSSWPNYLIILLFVGLLIGSIVYVKKCMFFRERIKKLQGTMNYQTVKNPGWKLSKLHDQVSYWENAVVEETFDISFMAERRDAV